MKGLAVYIHSYKTDTFTVDYKKQVRCVGDKSSSLRTITEKSSPTECPSHCPPLPPFVEELCQDNPELFHLQKQRGLRRCRSNSFLPSSSNCIGGTSPHYSSTPPGAGLPCTGLSWGRGHQLCWDQLHNILPGCFLSCGDRYPISSQTTTSVLILSDPFPHQQLLGTVSFSLGWTAFWVKVCC